MGRDESFSTPLLTEEEIGWKNRLSPTFAEKEILDSVSTSSLNLPFLSNATIHTGHGWFTSFRLFLIRLNRLLGPFKRAFLPALFSILGLSYGLSFAIDLFIVLKTTFIPISPTLEEQQLQYSFWKRSWIRFKKIIQEGNRPYRMLNDAIWFTINMITFCLVGPLYLLLNPILNTIGFGFDTTHEFFWFGRNLQKHTSLINKLTIELANTNKLLLNVHPDAPRYAQLQNDIQEMNFALKELQNKRKIITQRQIYTAIFTAIIFLGMALLFFPPTSIPGAFLIGSAIAFCAGSLFTGLGRRLYWSAQEYFPKLWRTFKKRFYPSPLNMNQKTSSPLLVQPAGSPQADSPIIIEPPAQLAPPVETKPPLQTELPTQLDPPIEIEPLLQTHPQIQKVSFINMTEPSPIISDQLLFPTFIKLDRYPCQHMKPSALIRHSILNSPPIPRNQEKNIYNPLRRRASISSM